MNKRTNAASVPVRETLQGVPGTVACVLYAACVLYTCSGELLRGMVIRTARAKTLYVRCDTLIYLRERIEFRIYLHI